MATLDPFEQDLLADYEFQGQPLHIVPSRAKRLRRRRPAQLERWASEIPRLRLSALKSPTIVSAAEWRAPQ
jgi:hypothetical protein